MHLFLMFAYGRPISRSEVAHIACKWFIPWNDKQNFRWREPLKNVLGITCMGVLMRFQAVFESKCLHANITLELPNFVMLDLNVLEKWCGACHLLIADHTDVWVFVFVMIMNAPFASGIENLETNFASKSVLQNVNWSVLRSCSLYL